MGTVADTFSCSLIDVALQVGIHPRPLLRVGPVHDQTFRRGRILNHHPSLLQDVNEHAGLFAQLAPIHPFVKLSRSSITFDIVVSYLDVRKSRLISNLIRLKRRGIAGMN